MFKLVGGDSLGSGKYTSQYLVNEEDEFCMSTEQIMDDLHKIPDMIKEANDLRRKLHNMSKEKINKQAAVDIAAEEFVNNFTAFIQGDEAEINVMEENLKLLNYAKFCNHRMYANTPNWMKELAEALGYKEE